MWHHCSEPQFPHLQNGNDISPISEGCENVPYPVRGEIKVIMRRMMIMMMIIIVIASIYWVLTVCQFLCFRPFMQNQESRFSGMFPEALEKGD